MMNHLDPTCSTKDINQKNTKIQASTPTGTPANLKVKKNQ